MRRAAIGLVATMLLSACTADTPDRNGQSTATSPPAKPIHLEIDPEPLWRSGEGDLPEHVQRFGDAQFFGDSLLIQGKLGGSQLAVVDAATGKPRWTAETAGHGAGQRLELFPPLAGPAPVVDSGESWTVLVGYNAGRATEFESGVAAVEGQSGRVRWRTPLNKLPQWSTDREVLVGADDKVAVSWFADIDDDHPKAMVLATDVTDGSTAWETTGMWPQFVTEDRVLGVTSPNPPGLDQAGSHSYVTALDAETGKKRWDLKNRYGTSELLHVAGAVALIATTQDAKQSSDDERAAIIVDAKTGRELAKLGNGDNCGSDGLRLIACFVSDPEEVATRLATFDLSKMEKHLSPEPVENAKVGLIAAVWGDYIFVDDGSIEGERRALDRNGNAISNKLPGSLVGISDEYAAFAGLADRPSTSYAVYRVVKAG